MKKNTSIYIIGAIALSVILYRIIIRKQEEKSVYPIKDSTNSSTTPVSGTSQTILEGFNENDAQQLKEELKK